MQAAAALKSKCHAFLTSQLSSTEWENFVSTHNNRHVIVDRKEYWGISPFFLDRRDGHDELGHPFAFSAPTTAQNAFRVLRAMKVCIKFDINMYAWHSLACLF